MEWFDIVDYATVDCIFNRVYVMKQYVRDAIFEELDKYCILSGEGSYIEVTEWKNGEGFDVSLYDGTDSQYFHLSWGQWELLKKMIKKMDLTV